MFLHAMQYQKNKVFNYYSKRALSNLSKNLTRRSLINVIYLLKTNLIFSKQNSTFWFFFRAYDFVYKATKKTLHCNTIF